MNASVTLRGMTWDHPRGYEPLRGCSAIWKERAGVNLVWDRRSLQDFESFPVEDLARRYDLIVIDHPHVGQITRENCLLPLDDARLSPIARGKVGGSYDSYRWQGQQWALPIDAATQVQAWRPDRLGAPARNWNAMLELARSGRVAVPMRTPHSLMCLFTLCAHLGAPGAVEGPDLFDAEVGSEAYERIRELTSYTAPSCNAMDPIAVFEQMAQAESKIDCVPLIYGYVNYSVRDFRPARIAFADMPTIAGRAPMGSVLGGTGIAVSARTAHAAQAMEFALWVAGAEVQSGPYVEAGGQAGHATAWADDAVNAAAGHFYGATRATIEGAWVRPRHDGYMPFQHAASERLNSALRAGEPARALFTDLNRMFRDSLPKS
jgi:multiple sugar transport system substrate-binding protein